MNEALQKQLTILLQKTSIGGAQAVSMIKAKLPIIMAEAAKYTLLQNKIFCLIDFAISFLLGIITMFLCVIIYKHDEDIFMPIFMCIIITIFFIACGTWDITEIIKINIAPHLWAAQYIFQAIK